MLIGKKRTGLGKATSIAIFFSLNGKQKWFNKYIDRTYGLSGFCWLHTPNEHYFIYSEHLPFQVFHATGLKGGVPAFLLIESIIIPLFSAPFKKSPQLTISLNLNLSLPCSYVTLCISFFSACMNLPCGPLVSYLTTFAHLNNLALNT